MPQIHVPRNSARSVGQSAPPSQLSSEFRARELCALAKRLAHAPKDHNADKWEEQLGHLVGRHLAAARDDVLVEAMHQAQTAQDSVTLDELGLQVEYEAEHHHLGLRPDGKQQEARLFAIPLMVPDVTQLGTPHLPQHPATDALVASLRVDGLVAPTQGLTLVKYLYHPDELDALTPSGVFRLCNELALAACDEVPCSGYELPEADGPTIGLRYLVGVVTGPASTDSLLLASDKPDDETAFGWAGKVDEWCVHAAQHLTEAFNLSAASPGGEHVRVPLEVFPVGGFYEARRLGEVIYKSTSTLADALRVLSETGIDPTQVHAIVAPYILDDKSVSVVASLTSKLDGCLLGTAAYPVSAFEQLDDALDDVHSMLETRVGEVSVVDTLVQAERCECCSKPMFLTPVHPTGSHWDMPALQANATFH
jgi:hypothetical protein